MNEHDGRLLDGNVRRRDVKRGMRRCRHRSLARSKQPGLRQALENAPVLQTESLPWSRDRVKNHIERRRHLISKIHSCNACATREAKCPYGLPIVDMLRSMVPQMEDMLRIWSEGVF